MVSLHGISVVGACSMNRPFVLVLDRWLGFEDEDEQEDSIFRFSGALIPSWAAAVSQTSRSRSACPYAPT